MKYLYMKPTQEVSQNRRGKAGKGKNTARNNRMNRAMSRRGRTQQESVPSG